MLEIGVGRHHKLREYLHEGRADFPITTSSIEEKVRLLILRDLMRLGWHWDFDARSKRVTLEPPDTYDKQLVKHSMQMKREESLKKHETWIGRHLALARGNLADGEAVWNSSIEPVIEVCETQKQIDTFRIFRFYWSSPYSEYVGRRIKLLIRDRALPGKPVIALAALGSSIVHIPERDMWVGWDTKTRTENLIYTMDAYILGAMPPYNYLLGGKLAAYILASNEVRKIYKQKYKGRVTNISRRTANDLACIFTTSLYGKSSQYNRLNYGQRKLYIPTGQTKGYGTLHLTDATVTAMQEYLASIGLIVTNKFGDGPSWRFRLIRTAAEYLGFDADFLLRHSFQRNIYAIPLAENAREFLRGEQKKLEYFDYPMRSLVSYWKDRWLVKRKQRSDVEGAVRSFCRPTFNI